LASRCSKTIKPIISHQATTEEESDNGLDRIRNGELATTLINTKKLDDQKRNDCEIGLTIYEAAHVLCERWDSWRSNEAQQLNYLIRKGGIK
jgi:limonene-1,2-epoxide hydrolase